MTRHQQKHALPIFVAPPAPPDPLVQAGQARQRALIRAVYAHLRDLGARVSDLRSPSIAPGYWATPGPGVWKNLDALTIHLRYVPVPAPDLGHIWGPQRDPVYDALQEHACTSAALKLATRGYTATYIPPSAGSAWFMPQVMISAGTVDLTLYMEDATT